MSNSLAIRGFLSVIGACIITLVVGTMYLWGVIALYATSYFRIITKNRDLTELTTDLVFPLMLLGQAISMPFAARFARKTSARLNCMAAGSFMAAAIYMSSYSQSFKSFALVFGLLPGIAIGVLYVLPTAHCYQFYPGKQSSVSVLIIATSGLGTWLFGSIAHNLINYNNKSLLDEYDFYLAAQAAMLFPQYLRILSGCVFGLSVGGSLLLFDVPAELAGIVNKEIMKNVSNKNEMSGLMNFEFLLPVEESQQNKKNPFGNANYEMSFISKGFDVGKGTNPRDQQQFWPSINSQGSGRQSKNQLTADTGQSNQNNNQNKLEPLHQLSNECPRTSDGPRERIFWHIFLIIVLGTNFGLMTSVNYRTYAKLRIVDDYFLTTVGCLGAIGCGFSRYLCALAFQSFSFRTFYSLLLILNSFLALTIYYVDSFPFIYMLYVIASYICYGGHLGVFPAVCTKVFGARYGLQIYGLMFFAFPVSNFVQSFLLAVVEPQFGYWMVFTISGGMSIGALLLANQLELYNDWSQRIREHNERKRVAAR